MYQFFNSYLPWNYFNVSIFRWSLCHFYEIIRLLLCFFSDLYFPPKNSGKNIRSASGFFIAGIPFVKKPGLSFLHFRLKWCSLTRKRSCFAILGEISWTRSTYRLKFEHGQLGECLELETVWYDSAICRQGKKRKKNTGVSQPRWAIWREIWKLSSSSSSLVAENHQRTDVYFPAHAW